MAAGIETRHARSCRSPSGGRCNCEPTYRVRIWDGRRKQRIRRRFDSYAEARAWRRDALISLRRGQEIEAGRDATLGSAAAVWVEEARSGVVRTRGGDLYKPSAVRPVL